MEQGLKDKLNLMEVKYKKEENAHNMNFNKRLSQVKVLLFETNHLKRRRLLSFKLIGQNGPIHTA